MEERGKCRKRPDLQYYKPPKLVSKVGNKEGELVENEKMEEKPSQMNNSNYPEFTVIVSGGPSKNNKQSSPLPSTSSVNDQKNRISNKKPDKQVYIPRAKSNVHSNNGPSSLDGNRHRRKPDRHKEEDGGRSKFQNRDGHGGYKRDSDLQAFRSVDTISPLASDNSKSRDQKPRNHDQDPRKYHGEGQSHTFPRHSDRRSSSRQDNRKENSEEMNRNSSKSAFDEPKLLRDQSNQGFNSKHLNSIPMAANNLPYPIAQSPRLVRSSNTPDRSSFSQSNPYPSSSSPHQSNKTINLSSPILHQSTAQKQPQPPPQQLPQIYHVHPPRQHHSLPHHRSLENDSKREKQEAPNHRLQWTSLDSMSSRGTQSCYNNDRARNNKKLNRVDHKSFEQNLPPRLQRKLAMEKANQQNRNSQLPITDNPILSNQDYYSNPVIRGGIIRLPQDTNFNAPSHFNSSSLDRHVNQQNEFQAREYSNNDFSVNDSKSWVNTSQPTHHQPNNVFHRQLYDPYGTKPCVVIRPTTHQPYQPNDHHPQPRLIQLSGMIPAPVSAHNIINQINVNTTNNLTNDSGNLKSWSGSVNHQSSGVDRPLPTSPPLVHYLPNYSSLPHHTSNPQNESAQRNQTASPSYDSSSSTNTRRKLVEKNMNEIISLENELQSHLKKYPALDEKTVKTLRWKIQQRYQSIIVADPKFCAEHNVELSLWKSAFYQFIEMRRRELEEDPNSETSKDELLKLTEEATIFFESLLVMLQDAFNFTVDKYIEHHYDSEKPGYEMIKLAAISAQKIYLYLGDLARYKEQAAGGTNYSKAKGYYSKAQQIAPKNGRPYNQLALLAMYGRRRLDAVYNYMRSLAASNPFHSARESLLSIFEEVRKKYETAESKRLSERLGALKFSDSTSPQDEDFLVNNVFGERLEIWIRPDGTSSKHTSVMGNESEEEELDLLTDIDLNKRFVLSFLHVHGKLFTKIGLETFNSAVNQMLLELRCLLKRFPFPMSSQRLLQLMTISMFSVYHSSFKDGVCQPTIRTSLQEQSIQVTLAMVSLLLDRIDNSLKDHIAKGNLSNNIVTDDVVEILPAIKVWTDWMSCQKQFWSPPLPKPEFRIGVRGDIWSLFAEVLTRLGEINTRSIKLLPTKFEGCEQVILPEDSMLSGFIPLLGAPSALSYLQPPFDKEKARTCLRVSRIQFFGDYLCGIPEPYLEFDVGKKRFNSSVKSHNDEDSESGHNISLDLDDDLEDIPTDSSSGDNLNLDEDDKKLDDPELKELWSRQEVLRKAQKREEKIRKQLDAMLREEKRRRLVIQPRFLIPDTNCFVHHLSKLQTLVNCGHFEIIVPLIVINELNGLMSRVTQPSSDSPLPPIIREGPGPEDLEHEKKVGQAAKEAFEYLEAAFNEKNSKLKAITTKGSLLNSMNFRTESFKVKRTNNDDLVLSCCLQFIKKRSSSKQTNPEDSDGIVNIFRETVLLTDDRNLRVKALSHNVPVKSLPVFLQFANLQ